MFENYLSTANLTHLYTIAKFYEKKMHINFIYYLRVCYSIHYLKTDTYTISLTAQAGSAEDEAWYLGVVEVALEKGSALAYGIERHEVARMA